MSRNPDEIETKSNGSLSIGSYRFDMSRKELRTADEVLVPLRAQSSEILAVLGQNPNQVVAKDELIERVWEGTFVTDDSLVQCIVDIRRALGKSAHEIIETFPKQGYRLNVVPLNENDFDAPARPAIAVLPFDNLSGDPDQEYFADGMTEDIITGLSRFHSLFVIARNSTFVYKDKSTDVRVVARDLGVRYVLEGSVRRAGERIRITGQLVDAVSGNHLWAERYDRQLDDIFAIQDEITKTIIAAIAPEIDYTERERAQRKPPSSLGVWGLYQRGLTSHQSAMGEECKSVIEQFDKVCELDSTFAPAFAMAASSRVRYVLLFDPDDPADLLIQAQEKALMGITLDPRDATCLWAFGRVQTMLGQYDVAISSIEDAVSLNPNDSLAHYYLAIALGSAGRLEEAISKIDFALRLNPQDIAGGGFLVYRSFVLFDLERYEEAVECARRANRSQYSISVSFEIVTAALIKLGRQEEAAVALGDLLNHTSGTTLSGLQRRPWIGRPEAKERFLGALREAGLPE
jgi:TolB-like protein